VVERILSPRILHFTKHQVFWDCGSLSACEVFPTGLPFPLDHKASTDRHWRGRLTQNQISSQSLSGANDNESSYTFWTSAVENYANCNLTNQGDKTVAIWSIAKLLRDVMSEDYAVGMWSAFLEEQLAWRVRDTNQSERAPELQINVPSWSWASIKGAILPQNRLALRSYKVRSHDGSDLSFTVEAEPSRDKEPKLKSRALQILGQVNIGKLVRTEDGYCVQVPVRGSQTVRSNASFDAFLDESLESTNINPNRCTFVILAATVSTITQPPQSHIPDATTVHKTHSGIGLVLISRAHWYEHQEQQFDAFRKRVGSGKLPRETQWRLEAFEKLMLQRPKTKDREVYRRVGVIHFRDVDDETFEWLTSKRKAMFWLE
jgi:hypothetical protein